ncbi:hypothetical protein ACWEVP_12980 [Amycolatopsis sp. NPDC003865]
MAANQKPDTPEDLARSRQHIEEAKDAAAKAELADPVEEKADEALETDPSYHHGEQSTT